MNMYRSEHIPYCTYFFVLYVQDTYTIAHIVRICMYLCTYIHTKHKCIRTGVGFHICTYMYVLYVQDTYRSTSLLMTYDNVLSSLKEKEGRRSPVQKSGSAINYWQAVGPALSSVGSGTMSAWAGWLPFFVLTSLCPLDKTRNRGSNPMMIQHLTLTAPVSRLAP